jgi:hypothetical protein
MSSVIVGKNRQIDLSWNNPNNNGYSIKNCFFYNEENANTSTPIVSYYSYQLPIPNTGKFISFTGADTGFDINSETTVFSLIINSGFPNYFDLLYGGEIELSWEYHSDSPFLDLCSNFVYETTMDIYIVKTDTENNSIVILDNTSRIYDSHRNKLGPNPNNNGIRLKDIFTIAFDPTTPDIKKRFNKTDTITVNISLSSLTYIPYNATSITDTKRYSIIVKDITIAPYRLPFSQYFMTLPFGQGGPSGFIINNANASNSRGAVYYMPRLMNPMVSFQTSKIQFAWKYDFDISLSQAQLGTIGITDISNIQLPYRLRIRGYTRSFIKLYTLLLDEDYNTTNYDRFMNIYTDVSYNTSPLFDYDISYVALYSDIKRDASNNRPIITNTFDLSNAVFPSYSQINNPSHDQFIFIISIHLDTSLPVYNNVNTNIYNNFRLCFLSYTYTPLQYYRFSTPDPIIPLLPNSPMNTVYNIIEPYNQITPKYSFYGLTNGSYYGYKIAANNFFGTSAFSNKVIARCGSAPNRVFSSVYSVESYNQRNQISVIWERPSFSGYEIVGYRVQFVLDLSGSWLDYYSYTADAHPNDISFNMFYPYDISNSLFVNSDSINSIYTYITGSSDITDVTSQIIYRFLLKTYKELGTNITGVIQNGKKYYIRVAGMNIINNAVQIGEYSPIYSGVSITFPINIGINELRSVVNGNDYIVFTWKAPFNDGGGPILDYLIEYAEVSTGRFQQYYKDDAQPRDKLSEYKYIWNNRYDNRPSTIATIQEKKTTLLNYKINPMPIDLYDIDRYNASTITNGVFNRTLILTSSNVSYAYESLPLTQNEFDLNNIQFSWYYLKNSSSGSGSWNINTKITIKLHANIYLKSINDPTTKFNLFTLSSDNSYNVTKAMLSDIIDDTVGFRYINYTDGSIVNSSSYSNIIPKINLIDKQIIDSSFSNTTIINTENIVYSYTTDTFTDAIGYLESIQMKWYYIKDPNIPVGTWNVNTNIAIQSKIVINGYITNSAGGNKINIFSIPVANSNTVYTILNNSSFSSLSDTVNSRYVNYYTGNIIDDNNTTPIVHLSNKHLLRNSRLRLEIIVDKLEDASQNKFNIRFAPIILNVKSFPLFRINGNYKLYVDTSYNILSDTDNNNSKFDIYFSKVILNGTTPLAMSSNISTRYSYRLSNNTTSTLIRGRNYTFRVRPFNISDYFENIAATNQFSELIDSSFANPITNVSYLLNDVSGGGSVSFKWSYGTATLYNILVSIPYTYQDESVPNEYPINSSLGYSIKTVELDRSVSGISQVEFSIPSVLTTDICGNLVQTRLRNGRSYTIQIAANKTVQSGDITSQIIGQYVTISNVIPFTNPLRPVSLKGETGNLQFTLFFELPNITLDPNYYVTYELPDSYYKYKYYVLEYKPTLSDRWDVSNITIPEDSFPGQIITHTITGVLNDTTNNLVIGYNYNVRIKLAIVNNYNNQQSFSEYTYLTFLNNSNLSESSSNFIYASTYPSKMPPISRLNIWKITSTNNQIGMVWNTPNYNGRSTFYYYEYQFSSTPTVETSWLDVYHTTNGIANQSSNALYTDVSFSTINIPVAFTLTCKSNIQAYSIRIRIKGFNTRLPSGLPDMHPITNRQAISEWSNFATISL